MKSLVISVILFTALGLNAQTSDCLTNGAGKKPLFDAQRAKKAAMTMDSISNTSAAISEYKKELDFRLKAERLCADFDLKKPYIILFC